MTGSRAGLTCNSDAARAEWVAFDYNFRRAEYGAERDEQEKKDSSVRGSGFFDGAIGVRERGAENRGAHGGKPPSMLRKSERAHKKASREICLARGGFARIRPRREG